MLSRQLLRAALPNLRIVPRRNGGHAAVSLSAENPVTSEELTLEQKQIMYPKLGNRDIVGYGMNGTAYYTDRPDYPFPAVRFKENIATIMAIREKEEGAWKDLTIDEKRELYRHSFCQTFVEMEATTGDWKQIFFIFLLHIGVCFYLLAALKTYVYVPKPSTYTEENKIASLERMVALGQGRIEGVSSKWDYDKNEWKK